MPVWSIVAVAMVAVVGLVWALGGFERRHDLLQLTSPGTTITTGPYQLTFTEVTAKRNVDFDNNVYWVLTAVGTGRTTGDESLAPEGGDDGAFVSKDTRSGEIESPSGVRYGAAGSFSDGAQFTPGLPPIPIQVDFRYAGRYVPDQTLRFVVFKLEYTNTALLGDGDKTWHRSHHGFDYRLPVRVLPPATS